MTEFGKIRVAIFEDEIRNAIKMVCALRKFGFVEIDVIVEVSELRTGNCLACVLDMRTGKEASQQLNFASYGLIFMDGYLRKRDGKETPGGGEIIPQIGQDIPVIAISSFGNGYLESLEGVVASTTSKWNEEQFGVELPELLRKAGLPIMSADRAKP